jgi:tetratricopeptide (TPR) repeat protein
MKHGIYIILLVALLISVVACMDPEYYHLKKGDEYSEKKKWSEAIVEYTKSIEISPKLIQAYSNRATAYTENGQYEKAIADCTKAIEMDPKSVIPYYNRSIAYLYNREYNKAILDCEKIIELGLNSAWVYYHRGMGYYGLGDYSAAINNFVNAKKISSSTEFIQMVDQKIRDAGTLMSKPQSP